MTTDARDIDLVDELRRSNESEWLEFKVGVSDSKTISELCSALSNGAALVGRDSGYVIWGIDDKSRRIVGTLFNHETVKHGNQELPIYLARMLDPCPSLKFKEISHPQGRVVLLEVSAAVGVPTAFRNTNYVRIGNSVSNLRQHRQVHEKLISRLGKFNWEEAAAKEHLEQDLVLDLLDWEKYFERMKKPKPTNSEEICERLEAEGIIRKNDAGKWDITNLGAILFARNLSNFGVSMARKGIRLAVYRGDGKTSDVKDKRDGERGYVLDFDNILDRIYDHVHVREEVGNSYREDIPDFPKRSTRELLVNALVHQDFHITGAGPQIYVFRNRLQIDNPGESLIAPDRMIDSSPRSRNQKLADLMRRMDFCEERGSGVDIVIKESYKSPPPEFRVGNDSTQVILHGPRDFRQMSKPERVRACYQHAVITYLEDGRMTNATLRDRLGLSGNGSSSAFASGVIGDALNEEWIKSLDPEHPRSGYVPIWA